MGVNGGAEMGVLRWGIVVDGWGWRIRNFMLFSRGWAYRAEGLRYSLGGMRGGGRWISALVLLRTCDEGRSKKGE